MRKRTIGTVSSWAPSWQKPPCQWPGCKATADTTGKLGKAGFGNVCAKHKAVGDRGAR